MSISKSVLILIAALAGGVVDSASGAATDLKGDPFTIVIPTGRPAKPTKDTVGPEARKCRYGLCYPDFPVPQPRPARLISGT